jgi:hypothetical protein
MQTTQTHPIQKTRRGGEAPLSFSTDHQHKFQPTNIIPRYYSTKQMGNGIGVQPLPYRADSPAPTFAKRCAQLYWLQNKGFHQVQTAILVGEHPLLLCLLIPTSTSTRPERCVQQPIDPLHPRNVGFNACHTVHSPQSTLPPDCRHRFVLQPGGWGSDGAHASRWKPHGISVHTLAGRCWCSFGGRKDVLQHHHHKPSGQASLLCSSAHIFPAFPAR